MAAESNKHKSKSKSKNLLSLIAKNKLILFVIIFAAIASTILIISHAASPNVALEAENGSITGPATSCGTDNTASNNNCVQFKKVGSGSTFIWADKTPICTTECPPQGTGTPNYSWSCSAQQVAAATSCAMTFQEVSYNLLAGTNTGPSPDTDPLPIAYGGHGTLGDPRPGLICSMLPTASQSTCNSRSPMTQRTVATNGVTPYADGYSNGFTKVIRSDLASYSSMPACSGTVGSATHPAANVYHNCGGKTHFTSADDGNTYYFDNCTVSGQILVDDFNNGNTGSTASIYFTNCAFTNTGGDGNPNNFGRGGHLHMLHDVIDGSLQCSGAGNVDNCFNHPVVFDSSQTTDDTAYYNDFYQNTDQARIDVPVDFEWNYIHNDRCYNNSVCSHTDGAPEIYWNNTGDATHQIIVANNYFADSGADSSSGMGNIVGFDCNSPISWVTVAYNKALIAGNNGVNDMLTADCSSNPGTIQNISAFNNAWFENSNLAGVGGWNRGSGTCNTAIPNTCIIQKINGVYQANSGNKTVTRTGTIASWP